MDQSNPALAQPSEHSTRCDRRLGILRSLSIYHLGSTEVCHCHGGGTEGCHCHVGGTEVCHCHVGGTEVCHCHVGGTEVCHCHVGGTEVCHCHVGALKCVTVTSHQLLYPDNAQIFLEKP